MFEGHHTITKQITEAFSKMWVLQYFNTAILLILINNRLSDNGLIRKVLLTTGSSDLFFNGKYADFTTEWYGVVGVTIFTTAFINGLTPLGAFGQWVGKYAQQCLDRRCSSDRKKTSKILQSEYEDVYTGKVIEYDNRYSQIIAMIWVIMMFGVAIPVLSLAGALLCFVTYWTDKTLYLKFY